MKNLTLVLVLGHAICQVNSMRHAIHHPFSHWTTDLAQGVEPSDWKLRKHHLNALSMVDDDTLVLKNDICCVGFIGTTYCW